MTKPWRTRVTFAVVLYALASASLFAQATAPSLPDDSVTAASSQKAQLLSTGQDQSQQANQSLNPSSAPQDQDHSGQASVSQPGIILGTVTDMNEAPIPGASVAVEGPDGSDVRTVTTNENGLFEIRDVEPGQPYEVSIRAAGFSEWKSPVVTLELGQSKILDVSKLRISEVQTTVTVTPESTLEIATEQVKAEEKQRGFGIIPNFYAVYDSNPAPLTPKLKLNLALRVSADEFTLGGVALLAGIGQATSSPKYALGAKGYGERFGANYANSLTDIMFDGLVFPTILHQDPRYYYQGTGSTGSRTLHALSSLIIAKGDDGRTEPNYSQLGGDLASAAMSNLYYPRGDRGAGRVLQGFAINTTVHVAVRLLDEFVFRASTPKVPE